MKDGNELFELCKQVYEATGWTADMDKGVDYVWCHETLRCLPIDWDTSDFHQHIPLYTSDYLLEKLPKKIKRDSSTGWLTLSPMDSQGAWSVAYEPDHTEHIDDYPMGWGKSPVIALLKLTLKLHEEKIL